METFIAVSAFCGLAQADFVTTELHGVSEQQQENVCLHLSAFLYQADCSYARERPAIGGKHAPWVGPSGNPVYYRINSPESRPDYQHKVGDYRITPPWTAELTIDDASTPDIGSDDRVSGRFIIGAASRSIVARAGGGIHQAVETWSRITHQLDATPVSSATRNSFGGFDYLIASRGWPDRLCLKGQPQDCFPAAQAPEIADGKWAAGSWGAPSHVPIGRDANLGGNVGGTTRAVIEDYQCADDTVGLDCRTSPILWGQGHGPAFDNLLLAASTDAHGHIRSVKAFWTQEMRLEVGPPDLQPPPPHANSWVGGYMELQP
jgi:hypothetical protein